MSEAASGAQEAWHGAATSVAGAKRHDVADWQVAHRELTRLAQARAGLDFDEGKWLLSALRAGTHMRLGYGSFAEYIERLFGYAPRHTHDRLRVAEALEALPQSAHALGAGQVSWSALRELTRVATPGTEQAWLGAAHGRTVREVERLVSGHRPGDHPEDQPDLNARRHVLRFEVSGEVLASFREALGKLRRNAGGPLDDDDALLLMARHVLGGPADAGRASYQVAVTICPTCQSARQHGLGGLVEVASEVAAMAKCDAQQLAPVVASAGTDAHVGVNASHRASHGAPRAKQDIAGAPRAKQDIAGAARAKQDIAPAVRRQVLRRDGQCCVFPGCRHATFLDIHHVRPRGEGGRHEPNNLVTLCGAHHRAIHRGDVVLTGCVATGLHFRHADGSLYGGLVSTAHADRQAQAFRALTKLGFGDREASQALTTASTHVGAGLEQLLRGALSILTDAKAS